MRAGRREQGSRPPPDARRRTFPSLQARHRRRDDGALAFVRHTVTDGLGNRRYRQWEASQSSEREEAMSLRSTAWVAAALLSTLFLFGGAHFQQEDATSSGRPVTARVEASAAQHHTRYLPLMMRPLPPTGPRGYLTTPQELAAIREKAARGIEPYRSAMAEVLEWANSEWDYALDAHENCSGSDDPKWLDNEEGGATLYAKALAYHLTGESRYAAEVKTILEQIMTRVETISVEEQQCRLNFGWGT